MGESCWQSRYIVITEVFSIALCFCFIIPSGFPESLAKGSAKPGTGKGCKCSTEDLWDIHG